MAKPHSQKGRVKNNIKELSSKPITTKSRSGSWAFINIMVAKAEDMEDFSTKTRRGRPLSPAVVGAMAITKGTKSILADQLWGQFYAIV
jgi:hypothetical protein